MRQLPSLVLSDFNLRQVKETGECFLEGVQIYPRRFFEACHKRLGNISEISHLRMLLEDLGVDSRWVIYEFVSSGSHSGDTVRRDRVQTLQSEIARLTASASEELQQFLKALEDLATVAQTQENPIVFE